MISATLLVLASISPSTWKPMGDLPHLKLTVTQSSKGQELAIDLPSTMEFKGLLSGTEKFDLVLCFIPKANKGDVVRTLDFDSFRVPAVSWTSVNGSEKFPEHKPIFTAGNFENPSDKSSPPAALYIIIGHFDAQFPQINPEKLAASRKIAIPLESWITGSDVDFAGEGWLGVCLAKSKDHYLKGLTRVTNVGEIKVVVGK
jgi:hypothetical protein